MQDIANRIFVGRDGLPAPPVSTIAMLPSSSPSSWATSSASSKTSHQVERGIITSFAFLFGALLSGLGLHRHVRRRPSQHPHRRRRPAQPGRGADRRPARRRRLRLPRRRPRSARRQRIYWVVYQFAEGAAGRGRNAVLDRRLRLRRQLSSPSSPSSAAASTPRRPTSAPDLVGKVEAGIPKTTRATRR